MSEIQIDRNIPIPDRKPTTGGPKYPFDKINVGDSFWIPKKAASFSSMIYHWGKKLKRKFIIREETRDGIVGARIWRTK